MVLLNLNQSFTLLDSVPATPVESAIVCLPIRCTTFTWQTIYDTEPSVADITIFGSLDGVNFAEIDDSDVVTGEIRTVNTNCTHIKAGLVTATDGADISVLIVPKDL